MIKRISIFTLAVLFVMGCSDPVSVESIEAPVSESRRFAPPADDFKKLTIADIVVAVSNDSGEFSILLAALQKAELVGAVDGKQPLTVFAPTNAAFVSLLGELGASSLDDIDKATLTQVLLYHVVGGRRVASIVLGSDNLHTLQGGKLTVDAKNGALIDANHRSANIVGVDIAARNGIVHVIDRVVLP